MHIKELLDKVKTISDAEAEKCDYVVCVKKAGNTSPFRDNFTGHCCECGEEVIYRWHAPRMPKKICVECMISKVEAENNAKGLPKRVG